MSTEGNKTIVRRFYEEVMTGRNLSLLDELVAPDYSENDEAGQPGRNGLKQFLTMFSAAFPDAVVIIQHLIAEDDMVAAHMIIHGTHRGDYYRTAPTGKQATWRGTHIYRVTGGMIRARWGDVDRLGLMTQLGLILPPSPGNKLTF